MQITAENILAVYGWGFGSVLLMWSFGYVTGLAVQIIRKL